MKRIISALTLTAMLIMPAFALAVEPGDSVPTGLSPCEMQHTVRGCQANMTDPEQSGVLTNCSEGAGPNTCNIEACCLLDRIYTIADWIFVVLLVIAAIFILWGALEFITSGGDPEKVGSARNKLIWALVGVVVAFISKGLVRLITQIIKK